MVKPVSGKKKHKNIAKQLSGSVQKHKEKLFKKPKLTKKVINNQLKTQGYDSSLNNKKHLQKRKEKKSVSLHGVPLKKKKKKVQNKVPSEEDGSEDSFPDISEEGIESDDDEEEENEVPEVMENFLNKQGAANKYNFVGDISEEDVDSDDNFSLDENELPVPPDATTTEDESSSEEEEQIKHEKVEIVSQQNENESRTVFVGNLPKLVTKAKLKKWFAKFGRVECVRLRCGPVSDPSIPKKIAVIKKTFHDERSNIHGFVRFSTKEEAKNALTANGEPFDETHHLRVDMAGIKGQHKRFDDKKAVFVGNVPFGAEEDQLRDHFADCGDIICIRIVRDKRTSVGKGFAFINFAARHSVRLALEKDGIELDGRQLRVQKAFYNQEVEIVRELQNAKNLKSAQNKNKNNIKATDKNVITKFKKKKKRQNEGEESEYQGLRSNKDLKRKKISKKKKKVKQKKEVLKKILNTEGKVKRK